jgi:hypothetical protein
MALQDVLQSIHDEDMAAAILDRVLERGRFIHLDGPSGRTRHLNLSEILPAGTDRARISGIEVPEFQEPTGLAVATKVDYPLALPPSHLSWERRNDSSSGPS